MKYTGASRATGSFSCDDRRARMPGVGRIVDLYDISKYNRAGELTSTGELYIALRHTAFFVVRSRCTVGSNLIELTLYFGLVRDRNNILRPVVSDLRRRINEFPG